MRVIAPLLLAVMLLAGAEPLARVFEQAVKALSSADYRAAEEGFQKVLAAAPDHIGALQNLGLVYSRTGRLELATATYQRALQVSPHHKAVLMNLGLAYVQRESYGAALPVFRDLVSLEPANLPARELLATCEFYSGQVAAATARFESLLPEDRRNLDLLYLLSLAYLKQDHPEKLSALLEPLGANSSEAAFVLCRAYGDAGRADEAAEHCRQLLVTAPDYPGAHREIGKLLASQRDPEAIRELTAAIRQGPEDAEALYTLGTALLQENRTGDAVQSLEHAVRLRPGFWGNYYYLGKAKLQMGQAAPAIPLLQQAAQLNPRASVVFYELGRALRAAGRQRESEAAMQRVRELRTAELENDMKALHRR